ncbi:excalibur calcium-binding domain-containing protein [Actinoplanes sichuanensis]|uniref:Excalibur calcium-binding domain-containing protein n=1 Tax=Actinoplanes sichuanensis TaxID=512349 RepID=A0ABW4ASI2_9ACTN|nr:excalibur calcium-binding domain-containing protein [Actinoplanes sichuanensis]
MPPPQDPWAGQPGQPPQPRPGNGPPTPPAPPTASNDPNHDYGPPIAPGRPGVPHPGYGRPPAYGQAAGYGRPPVSGQPAYGTPPPFGPPPTAMFAAQPAPTTNRKSWHKPLLGVLGVLTLCVCGVALFSPDQETDKTSAPADSPEVAALQQAATKTPEAGATPEAGPTTSTAPKKPTATTNPKATPTRTASKSPKAVYYANCDAAPGELSRSDPGYRKALDRDGDGIACESSGDDEEPIEDDEPTGGTDPRFSTCKAANSAGYGDYVRGVDPEYDWYQDRDGDGIVCER